MKEIDTLGLVECILFLKNSLANTSEFFEIPDLRFSIESFINYSNLDRWVSNIYG